MKVASTNDVLAKIAINKSLLKEYSNSEYSRIVYMRDNSEFQIQIFNPYSYTFGVDITIDNKSLGNRLILKPGERVWLERYFTEARKFKFSTYEVSGTNREVKEAIAKNGEIELKFYKESEPVRLQTTYIHDYIYQPYNYKLYNDDCFGSSINYCDANIKSLSAGISDATSVTSACYNTTLTTSLGLDGLKKNDTSINASNKKISKSIETGRVEKGSYSNQQFETLNINFEYIPFHTETIKVLPESQKPIHKNDLQKQYCSNCGRKLNLKYKYCPYCGAKVDFCPNNKQQQKDYVIEKCPYCGRNVRSTMMECPHCGEILR